ncbi:DUF2809 domain-containing protein [Actinomadura luteofluorescens]|uniref:DUF2809 domain-containing protein n=1 Tax=Actinomadura luteofluorescens TaxID=46163 RepID=UPI0036395392
MDPAADGGHGGRFRGRGLRDPGRAGRARRAVLGRRTVRRHRLHDSDLHKAAALFAGCGAAAIAYCWFIEFAQLTPVPEALSQRGWIVRQLLGARFDPVDVAWYPVGVVPLVAAHWFFRARARSQAEPTPVEL